MRTPGHVVVIGGGFAGLSCAVALAGRGARVTLLEARRALGGRAGSFTDEATGAVVDNGQHLFMACYHATRSFLAALGTQHLVRFQRRLTIDYLEPGRRTRLACPPLPAPWHLLAGVLTLKGLTNADRTAFLRAARALRRLDTTSATRDLETITVTQWLDSLGQTEGLRRRLWHPLAIAALNASPDAAPASLLARVLAEGFTGDSRASGLGFATVGLSDLYTEASRAYVERRGGAVLTGVAAAGVRVAGGLVEAIETRDGEPIRADAFVSSVSPQALARLGVAMPGLEIFDASPILSINLWLDRPASAIAPFDFAGMLGGRVQWLFNKERILSATNGYLAAVTSAAADLVARSNDDLAAMAWEEIRACLPAARDARVTRSMVVRERTATYAASVASEPLRPGPRSPYPNLLLAGDWTMRGMPATIEAAVRSGRLCADLLTQETPAAAASDAPPATARTGSR